MRLQGEPDEDLDKPLFNPPARPKPDDREEGMSTGPEIELKPAQAFAIGITTIVALMLAAADAINHHWTTAGKVCVGAILLAVWAVIIGSVLWVD